MSGNANVTLVGNLGSDPEVRTTPSGKEVTELRMAVTPRVKVNGSWEDGETMWFDVSVWGNHAGPELRKGSRVAVTGSLRSSTYTNKQGAEVTRYRVDTTWVASVHRQQQSTVEQGDKWDGTDPW